MAPGAVNKQACQKNKSDKYSSKKADYGRIENIKRVDPFYQIKSPNGRKSRNYNEESNADCICKEKREFELTENYFPAFASFVNPEDEILQNTKLANPRTDKFVGDNHKNQEGENGE